VGLKVSCSTLLLAQEFLSSLMYTDDPYVIVLDEMTTGSSVVGGVWAEHFSMIGMTLDDFLIFHALSDDLVLYTFMWGVWRESTGHSAAQLYICMCVYVSCQTDKTRRIASFFFGLRH
jgi:hypothetical protein